MHKIESSLSTRAGAARGRRGVRAWLRNRAAVPATSPAPVSTPINPTVRVGSERGGAIVPTCPRRPRPSARSERHPRRGVDEKMQKREWNDAVSLSREIILSPMNRPGSSRGERQWAGNAADDEARARFRYATVRATMLSRISSYYIIPPLYHALRHFRPTAAPHVTSLAGS